MFNTKRLLCLFLLFAVTGVSAQKVRVHAALNGHWLHPQNNEWLVSFAPTFAVYKSGFWDYSSIGKTKNAYAIKLMKGNLFRQ